MPHTHSVLLHSLTWLLKLTLDQNLITIRLKFNDNFKNHVNECESGRVCSTTLEPFESHQNSIVILKSNTLCKTHIPFLSFQRWCDF
jgi:hypothetical protein